MNRITHHHYEIDPEFVQFFQPLDVRLQIFIGNIFVNQFRCGYAVYDYLRKIAIAFNQFPFLQPFD